MKRFAKGIPSRLLAALLTLCILLGSVELPAMALISNPDFNISISPQNPQAYAGDSVVVKITVTSTNVDPQNMDIGLYDPDRRGG